MKKNLKKHNLISTTLKKNTEKIQVWEIDLIPLKQLIKLTTYINKSYFIGAVAITAPNSGLYSIIA